MNIKRLVIVLSVMCLATLACSLKPIPAGERENLVTPPPVDAETSLFITLTSPQFSADQPPEVSVSGFTVKGKAGGLFENSLVVQALDSAGNVVAQVPVTYESDEMTGVGSWEASIIPDVEPGSTGIIRAYAASARDGSILAEVQGMVTYR
jgi:hypothetical protein